MTIEAWIILLNQIIGGVAFALWSAVLWREMRHAKDNGGIDARVLALLAIVVMVSGAWLLQALIVPAVDAIRMVGMAARMGLVVTGLAFFGSRVGTHGSEQ